MDMDVSRLITPSKYHRTLNGIELVKAREAVGLTQAEFAERCGWSRAYQEKLENLSGREIYTKIANRIIIALNCR